MNCGSATVRDKRGQDGRQKTGRKEHRLVAVLASDGDAVGDAVV